MVKRQGGVLVARVLISALDADGEAKSLRILCKHIIDVCLLLTDFAGMLSSRVMWLMKRILLAAWRF